MKILISEKANLYVYRLKKNSPKDFAKVEKALKLFVQSKNHSSLRVHKLGGELSGFWSMSAGKSVRIVFEYINEEAIIILAMGTHEQVYRLKA